MVIHLSFKWKKVSKFSRISDRINWGDFVPTVTVNSNLIPVSGIERLEVLRDGASAIYGADAVAGVVNNVLQTDYEGLSVTARFLGMIILLLKIQKLQQNGDHFSMVEIRMLPYFLITTTETISMHKRIQGGVLEIIDRLLTKILLGRQAHHFET